MASDLLATRAGAAGCVVRPVRDADGEQLFTLVGGVFAEYPGCVLDRDGIDADLHAWESHLAARDGAGWVLEDDTGRLVACVGVAPTSELPAGAAELPADDADLAGAAPAAVELKRLYVDADLRRRGIGAALVRRVEAWARAEGADLVVLWSDTRFGDAHRLYSRLGYHELAAERHLDDPSDTTETAFARALPPRH